MNRILSLILLIATAGLSYADIPSGYYQRLDGKRKEELKTAAYQTVRPHTVVTYNSLFPTQFPKTDVYPELYNGQKRWWEMYSDMVFYVSRGWSGMNREHSFPKSWWGGDQNEAYTDLNHLYPSESSANMAKSNYPLGEVMTPTFNNGVTTVGYAYAGQGGGAAQVFEPADEYKGDFARTYFYMATCYQDYTWKYTYMVQNGTYPTLKPWAYELLLDWARRDPVSQKEIMRNEAVYQIQGNRNPFIDFPELAEYIWGTRTTETFYLADQGSTITPPITGEPELFAPIDGSSIDLGEVAVGKTQEVELLINGANLTSALSVRITGEDRGMYTLYTNSIPASQVNGDTGYKLTIRYTPTAVGEHTAALTIYDGGFPAGKTFHVDVHGKAYPVPVLTPLKALAPENLSATGYRARWTAPAEGEVVDYYIVNRTRHLPTGPVTTRLDAEDLFLDIDDRDENVEESYTVQSVRLGYESPLSNVITITTSSVLRVDVPEPLWVTDVPGGIRIMISGEHTDLIVTDISGKTVCRRASVGCNEIIHLPAGLYLVKTLQSPTPRKVLVK